VKTKRGKRAVKVRPKNTRDGNQDLLEQLAEIDGQLSVGYITPRRKISLVVRRQELRKQLRELKKGRV